MGMSEPTDDLIIQVNVGMWRQLIERIEALEALLPQAEPETVKRRRGTRLPEAYVPRADTIEKMADELHVSQQSLGVEHRKFCDYFYSVPGQKGVKVDWDRAWCNWMRTACERGSLRGMRNSPNDDKIRELMEMDVHAEGE